MKPTSAKGFKNCPTLLQRLCNCLHFDEAGISRLSIITIKKFPTNMGPISDRGYPKKSNPKLPIKPTIQKSSKNRNGLVEADSHCGKLEVVPGA
jgi:hypothetical protein